MNQQGEEETVTEEVLEWERKWAGEYSAAKLLPTDPANFTDLSGRVKYEDGLKSVELPPGWAWRGDWMASEWGYAWNMTASATWHPKDGPTLHVRRRRWSRVRWHDTEAPEATRSSSAHELVDLTGLRFVFSCRPTRSRREIAAMLGLDQNRVTLLSYSTPAAFLAAWARLFSQNSGRTSQLAGSESVLVVYDLDDADVLAAALLPLLTESGEYRVQGGQALLQARFSRFAVVLAGWNGPRQLLIDRLATERGTIPPIRLAITRLE